MNDEFQKTGTNTVTGRNGFVVEAKLAGGVLYRDSNGEIEIDSEWLVKPPKLGIILYKGSPGNRGLDKLERSRVDNIFSNVARALEYLGHPVEIWSSPSG
jgi:hypothetical protein